MAKIEAEPDRNWAALVIDMEDYFLSFIGDQKNELLLSDMFAKNRGLN